MQNYPLVSICCTTYNHEKFAEEGLLSLFNQTYKNTEIILIDDGSTDKTCEIIEKLIKQSPFPIDFFTQKNSGNIPANGNLILKRAKGKYIRLFSLDDIMISDSTEKMVRIMEQNPKLQFVASNCARFVDVNGNFLRDRKFDTPENDIRKLWEFEWKNTTSFFMQSILLRNDTIKAIGGYDEDMIGDDVAIRPKLFRYMIQNNLPDYYILNEINFYYRLSDSNIHTNKIRQIRSILQVTERYFNSKLSDSNLDRINQFISNNFEQINEVVLHKGNSKKFVVVWHIFKKTFSLFTAILIGKIR